MKILLFHILVSKQRRAFDKSLSLNGSVSEDINKLILLCTVPYCILECGDFLALDLGGTNFRILIVHITKDPEHKIEMDNQVYAISQQLMTGTGTEVRSCMW